MSQRAAATAMDIAPPHLSNLEKGLRGWTCAQMMRAAEVLGVQAADLLSEGASLDPVESALIQSLRARDPVNAAAAFSAALASKMRA